MKCHPLNRNTLEILENSPNQNSFVWGMFIIEDQRMNKSSNPDNTHLSDISKQEIETIMRSLGYNYYLKNGDMIYGDRIIRILGDLQTKEMCLVECEYIQIYQVLDLVRIIKNKKYVE